MSIIFIELDAEYAPRTANKDILVDVITGDGQSGAYVIFLDQELKGSNETTSLGKKSEVKGKITTVVTTIIDKLEETNWTSVTIIVSEGEHITTFGPFKKQVPKHLDTAIYILKIVHP